MKARVSNADEETPGTRIERVTTTIREIISKGKAEWERICNKAKAKAKGESTNPSRPPVAEGSSSGGEERSEKMGMRPGETTSQETKPQESTFVDTGTNGSVSFGSFIGKETQVCSKTSSSIPLPPPPPPSSLISTPSSPELVTIEISEQETQLLCSPWVNSLIIRLWGKILDQHAICNRIMSLWKLRAQPQLINIGSGFFVVTLGCIEDKWKALLSGPSFIEGHFLSVRLWSPGFSPSLAQEEAIAPVWMKIQNLPIEYFNQAILCRIGNAVGTFVGIDESTHNISAARFARICVFLDLAKFKTSSISINSINLSILLEGAYGFCLCCGNSNHPTATCKRRSVAQCEGLVTQIRGQSERMPLPASVEDDSWKAHFSGKVNKGKEVFSLPKAVSGKALNQSKGEGKYYRAVGKDQIGNLEKQNPNCRLDIAAFTKNLSSSLEEASKTKPAIPKSGGTSASKPLCTTRVDTKEELHPENMSCGRAVPKKHPQVCWVDEVYQSEIVSSPNIQINLVSSVSQTEGNHVVHLSPNHATPPQPEREQPEGTKPSQEGNKFQREVFPYPQSATSNPYQRIGSKCSPSTDSKVNISNGEPNYSDLLPLEGMGQPDVRIDGTSSLGPRVGVSDVREHFSFDIKPGDAGGHVGLQEEWTSSGLSSSYGSVTNPTGTRIKSDDVGCNSKSNDVFLQLVNMPHLGVSEGESPGRGKNSGSGNSGNSGNRHLLQCLHEARNRNARLPDSSIPGDDQEGTREVAGAASPKFRRPFMDLKARYNPNIMFISETRVGSARADNILSNLGFSGFYKVDPMGYAGGLWVLWDAREVKLTIQGNTFQEIHALLEVGNHQPMLICFIYASPILEKRKLVWINLEEIASVNTLPWLVCGDFNEVLSQEEKWGGNPALMSRIRDFRNCLNNCGLDDLGFVGQNYTWFNKRDNGHMILERIDRFLANAAWINYFPQAVNHHLPRVKSDHTPLLLRFKDTNNGFVKRPFRCERIWLKEPEFINIVEKAWQEAPNSSQGLNLIRDRALLWNRTSFGNVFQRKNRIFRRLEGVNKAMNSGRSPQLIQLEQSLAQEYQKILDLEEELWASKARLDWLQLGDSNTTFFHSSVINRRRKNKISAIKDDDFPSVELGPVVDTSHHLQLESIPFGEEIKRALWDLKPFKAAGLDGFQPGFFQSCWGFLEKDLVLEVQNVFNYNRVPHEKSINAVKHVLEVFTQSLGLSVNNSKSSIWFAPSTSAEDKRISDYKIVIDKMIGKMEVWNSKWLSKAGKVTLLNSVCSPMLAYYMQCLKLPSSVCKSIEKIQRNFFWQSGNKQSIHTINWEAICKPKWLGGLGIDRIKTPNQALLAKLAWRLSSEHHQTWAKMLMHYKFECGVQGSVIGKGIQWGQRLLSSGLSSVIYSCHNTKVWSDKWIGLSSLHQFVSGPLNKDDEVLSVNSFAIAGGGTFTIKIAYCFAVCQELDTEYPTTNNFKWIWKLSCPEKLKVFIWECPYARRMWGNLKFKAVNSFSSNCKDWIVSNATDYSEFCFHISKSTIFVFGLWELWLHRNRAIFEGKLSAPVSSGRITFTKSVEFSHLAKDYHPILSRDTNWVKWVPPTEGWWKLNTDGSCLGNPGSMAAAGIIRDYNGNWVSGFSKHLGFGNSFKAEVWAIALGIKLAKDLQCGKLIVKSDSLTAINLISDGNLSLSHAMGALIQFCRSTLRAFSEFQICHTLREGNMFADVLAKQTNLSVGPLVVHNSIPSFLKACFIADFVGIHYGRKVSSLYGRS
ncbi:reverse transcriptase [Senna tora]|uniref:Reverse transcriptase n=1 Tax=Senna tora TaxID=362788 RepID=A0A834WTT8_9FABA|nr:reverse transcriptase [Senna tora]